MVLILYGTEGCHLCDEAERLVRHVISSDIELQLVDIVDDDGLYEKYQFTIPVIANKLTSKSLNWPFSESDIETLL